MQLLILPYIKNLSECIRRILSQLNIRTCFKPHSTLKQLLVHPKDPIEEKKKSGAVYKISCKSCNQVYIGQTGRTLQHRITEHKRALNSTDNVLYNTSAVAVHAITQKHRIDWDNAKVIAFEGNLHKRCLLESWYIRNEEFPMNRESGTLPEVYHSLAT